MTKNQYIASELELNRTRDGEEKLGPFALSLATIIKDLDGNLLDNVSMTRYLSTNKLEELRNAINQKLEDYRKEQNPYIQKLNEFLEVRLENGRSWIYVKGTKFRQCTYLLLNIPEENVENFDEIQSIDEAEELLEYRHDFHDLNSKIRREFTIEPIEEFRANCSNLQAWVENDYNTQILHRTLAFPLLKQLVQVGDPLAKKAYKDEIAYRLESNDIVITHYLIQQGYLKDLSEPELKIIIENLKPGIAKVLMLDHVTSRFKNKSSRFDKKKMSLSLENGSILITSIERSALKYTDYKRPFNLDLIEKYSRYQYNKTFIDFGLTFRDQKLLFKNDLLQVAKEYFTNKNDILVEIPRGKAPLKLTVEQENLAIYIFPELMY